MQVLVTPRFEKDLAIAQARVHSQQILKTIRAVVENPAHPALRVRKAHLGVRYCKVNEDWRLLFEYDEAGAPVFLRVVSHAEFDDLKPESIGRATPAPIGVGDEEPRNPTSDSVSSWPTDYYKATTPTWNPLRNYTIAQLRLLGVPKQLVDAVRSSEDVERAIGVPGLPAHTQAWLMQLATDPGEPLDHPFETLKAATFEQLEGLCEGRIEDLFLRLSPEQQSIVDMDLEGPFLLRGCAGSGKSTIGIHRAIRMGMEGKRILFVTFSPLLESVTRNLIERLTGSLPDRLVVSSMRSWLKGASTQFSLEQFGLGILSDDEQHAHIEASLEAIRVTTANGVLKRDASFFADEIRRVIRGFGIREFEDYRAARRYGREEALSPIARYAVWRVFEEYERRLVAVGARDWGQVATEIGGRLASLHGDLPAAPDHIIVDEAQDLTPVELSALNSVVRGRQGTGILLLGDAAQSIYSRGFSWRQAGLDVVGRSRILRTNYRNTREIVQTARDLISRNTHLKRVNELTAIETVARSGPRPVVVNVRDEPGVVRFIADHALDVRSDNTLRLRDIAVLTSSRHDAAAKMSAALSAKGVPVDEWRDDSTHFDLFHEAVKVMPLHLAKGLEFPLVILVPGALSARAGPPMPDEDLNDAIERERERMLAYVGITRSADMLFLLRVQGHDQELLGELAFVDVVDM